MITCFKTRSRPHNMDQYGLRSLSFSGAKLWISLPPDGKQITPFSRFRQDVKNSVIDKYNKGTDN